MDKGLLACYTQVSPSTMKAKTLFPVGLLLVGALALGACGKLGYPKYVKWVSPWGDYSVMVPFGWNVKTDQEIDSEGTQFTNAAFIGGFDGKFFLGAPSLSIRWHGNLASHRLPDGYHEYYNDGDDYIAALLDNLYDNATFLSKPVSDMKFKVGGYPAKQFVVLSPSEAPEGAGWGISVDKDGTRFVHRKHAYVVVQLKDGFYVLVYPATNSGFKNHEKKFNQLVRSFTLLKHGPNGAVVKASPDVRGGPAKRK